MIHKKPTGDIGAVCVGGAGVNWDKIRFPDDKVSQEAKITSLFIQAIERTDGMKFQVRILPEADHDARLIAGKHEVDLQLMEIVFASKKGSPYRSQKRHYDAGYFVDQVIAAIRRKKYAINGRPLWLLLYPTHWAFVPEPSVEFLLHKYFAERQPSYERVFVMHILTDEHGELTELYPKIAGQRSDAIKDYPDAATARAQLFVLANPGEATEIPGGVMFPI
jgi:hypothetical protein